MTNDTKNAEIIKLRNEVKRWKNIADEGRRAIGDHYSPDDCYATGPVTGNAYRDLIECPACLFISMYDAEKREPK